MNALLRISIGAVVVALSVTAQDAAKQQLQEKLAAVKQSMAQNQTSLRQYTWTETTQISLKGEVKKTEQKQCLYGNDGKVQKTPIASPASAPAPPPRTPAAAAAAVAARSNRKSSRTRSTT